MTLGFDASSTTCGWAFTDNKTIIDCGFIDVSKIETNREKSKYVIDVLDKNIHIKDVSVVNLEASLSGFSGPSNRAVVIKLARFNAVFEYALEDYFGKKINLVGAMSARKQAFGVSRVKGIPPKVFVKTELEKLYDLSKWEVLNKKNTPDKRMEDIRDAVIISLYSK